RWQAVRAVCLRRVRAAPVLWLQCFGNSERKKSDGIENGVHHHRDQQRSAPLVGQSKTGPESKEGRERRQVHVNRSKKKRRNNESNATTEITPQNPVKKETEDEFLGHGRDHRRQ